MKQKPKIKPREGWAYVEQGVILSVYFGSRPISMGFPIKRVLVTAPPRRK